MIERLNIIVFLLLTVIISSGCINTRYITDIESINRQKAMISQRSKIIAESVFINVGAAVISGILNTNIEFENRNHEYKKVKLINESNDSILVNMVTDVFWEDSVYWDINDIVIPPNKKQKVLVPNFAAYNIYFNSQTTEKELIEIPAGEFKNKIRLKPGMTIFKD